MGDDAGFIFGLLPGLGLGTFFWFDDCKSVPKSWPVVFASVIASLITPVSGSITSRKAKSSWYVFLTP